MSSILKALKKLEDEKSLLQEEKALNVSRDILKQPPGSRIANHWLWFSGSLAVAVILILAVALIRKPATKETVQFRELPTASLPTPPLTPLRTLPTPQVTGSDKRADKALPAPLIVPQTERPQRLLPPSGESAIKSEPLELPNSATPGSEPLKGVPAGKSPPLRAVVASDATLTLSGVAWNKDSADRLAIINGQPIATGATVNGALVEEILPDRVKLSLQGRTFELLIGRTARTD